MKNPRAQRRSRRDGDVVHRVRDREVVGMVRASLQFFPSEALPRPIEVGGVTRVSRRRRIRIMTAGRFCRDRQPKYVVGPSIRGQTEITARTSTGLIRDGESDPSNSLDGPDHVDAPRRRDSVCPRSMGRPRTSVGGSHKTVAAVIMRMPLNVATTA